MRKTRFLLPVLLGLVSVALLSWEAHNSTVIYSMGMAWDTGAPMWPYQTPELLLAILNAPAYIIAAPVYAAFGLRTLEERAPVLLATITLLWFCVGRSLDNSVITRRYSRRRALGAFVPVALLCIAIGVWCVIDAALWWSEYGGMSLSQFLILTRTLGPVPWCAVSALVLICITIGSIRRSA